MTEVGCRGTLSRIRVNDRGVQLVGMLSQLQQEVVGRFDCLGRPCVDPVDLVDDDDRGKPERERLAQHDARLWHGSLQGVHQEETSISHPQHPFHLAAKVGVAGCVDDVDLDALVTD